MRECRGAGGLVQTRGGVASAMGVGNVAEGNEDSEKLEKRRTEGCDRGQGFLISRPIDADAIEAMLTSDSFLSRNA